MSNICVMVIGNIDKNDEEDIRLSVKQIVNLYGYGVFFELDFNCPIIDFYQNSLIISFADDYRFNNCERLILPDNCMFNGIYNDNSLLDRMNRLMDVARFFQKYDVTTDIFIGDCGCKINEYYLLECKENELSSEISDFLNNNVCYNQDVHVKIVH